MALMSRFELWMWTTIAAFVIVLTVLVARADAHPPHELDEWMLEWTQQADVALSPALLDELADMRTRHPCWTDCPSRVETPQRTTHPLAPAQIRALIEQYFLPQYVDDALRVAWCESRFDPSAANPRSSARGVFQHLGRYWPQRSVAAWWGGASILDAEANVAVAAWLSHGGASWIHWVCKPT